MNVIDRRPWRRHEEHYAPNPAGEGLRPDHPALADMRTIFPTTVIEAAASPRLLISGKNQRKLGDRVAKGHWRGMPIFALTLEERATCPSHCFHWRSCYGNNMHRSRRHRHSAELEALLEGELEYLQGSHPDGFLVRLHILGDFVDVAYAALWLRWLDAFPALHVFGFTAHRETSLVGELIAYMNRRHRFRCVVRFSVPAPGATPRTRYATTIWRDPEDSVVPEGIVCPAQTGATACCGTCALCWTTPKPIAFVAHARSFRQPRGRRKAKATGCATIDPEWDE